jgi:hypothetical protein
MLGSVQFDGGYDVTVNDDGILTQSLFDLSGTELGCWVSCNGVRYGVLV